MLKSLFHIIIAFLVFFSSAGFWVNVHYCQGESARTSFVITFGSCCAGMKEAPCSKIENSFGDLEQEDKDGCCHNDPSFHKLEQNQKIERIVFKSYDQLVMLNVTIPVINFELPTLYNNYIPFFNYVPPRIVYDRQVRLQTFLC